MTLMMMVSRELTEEDKLLARNIARVWKVSQAYALYCPYCKGLTVISVKPNLSSHVAPLCAEYADIVKDAGNPEHMAVNTDHATVIRPDNN